LPDPVRTRVCADISKNIFTATEDAIQGRTAYTTVDMALEYVMLTAVSILFSSAIYSTSWI